MAVRREWLPGAALERPILALPRCLGFAADACERPLFLDTETTGLAGGTGTVAFLVGLAWPEAGGTAVVQYFLCDFDQEPALLWAVRGELMRHGILVTYNGRTFDWPLLETRLILRRARAGLPAVPHLDLLPVVRRLFRPRLPDCALRTVEQALLALERAGDLPGHLVPGRYFAWLRGAPGDGLASVFAHNRQDVLSLAVLMARIETAVADGTALHPVDRFSRAGFLESRGFLAEALREYRALWRINADLPPRGAVGLRLARLLSRCGEWQEACKVLEECWTGQCYPYQAAIELAKLLEHQARDLKAARRLVTDALALLAVAVVGDDRWRSDLEHRRRRLDRRLQQRMLTLDLVD